MIGNALSVRTSADDRQNRAYERSFLLRKETFKRNCLYERMNRGQRRDVNENFTITERREKMCVLVEGTSFASCRLTDRGTGCGCRRRRRGTSPGRRLGTRVRRPTEARFDCQSTPNPETRLDSSPFNVSAVFVGSP